MHVTGIGWAGILTEDFESTLRFFSEGLGLSLVHRDEMKELAHFRFRSGQLLEVYGPGNRRRKEKYRWFNGPVLGFEVDDIQLARQEMLARGARFITEIESWENERWSLFLGPQEKLFEILLSSRKPAGHFRNILGICGARVHVQDSVAASHFFSKVMEMLPVQQENEREIVHYRLPAGHKFEVLVSSAKGDDPTAPLIIGFEVNDMREARREMESRGVEFVGPPEAMQDGSARSQFCAPDHFIYELVCEPGHQLQ